MSSPLTLDERYLIHACLLEKLSIAKIALRLGRHRSSINDERNRGRNAAGVYCPIRAQRHRDAASARSACSMSTARVSHSQRLPCGTGSCC